MVLTDPGRPLLRQRLGQLLLLDGAMGSQIMTRGLRIEPCPDMLCIQEPLSIASIHMDYIKAGCDAILTNTFGANPIALARYGLADRCEQINTAAVRIARQVAGGHAYIIGDIGPSGGFLEPLGTLTAQELRQGFAQQAAALLGGGVDGLIVETMTCLEEAVLAVEAIRSLDGQIPVLACMAFDAGPKGFKTMMGVDVPSAFNRLVDLGVDAIGFNCGSATLDQYVDLADQFVAVAKADGSNVALIAEPNAGRPLMEQGLPRWSVEPEAFAKALLAMYNKGVTILGGCCGTSPAHLQAAARLLKVRAT